MKDIANEAAVLGALLLEPAYMATIADKLQSVYFFKREHQIIFDALLFQWGKGIHEFDAVTTKGVLEENGQLEEIGGAAYIGEILQSVPSAANSEYYADRIIDTYRRRQLLLFGQKAQLIAESSGDIDGKYAEVDKKWRDLQTGEDDTSCIANTIQDVSFETDETFISTGYAKVDDIIYGHGKGDMTVIAARPGMGKTSLITSFALKIAENGLTCAIFSMEMTSEQLQQRLICSVARVDLKRALTGLADDNEKMRIESAKEQLSSCGLFIDTTPALTPEKLRAKILMLQAKHHLSAVFVDYLGLMRTSARQSRYESTTEISAAIKAIGLETGLPMIVAAQLNRCVEQRDDKRPRLSDLRDSGSIEQDADIVMMLYRESYYTESESETTELIINKNRRGKVRTIYLNFKAEFTSFEE